MHEYVAQPRRVYTTPQDDWDDDYDVYLFYPSRNRVFQVRQTRWTPRIDPSCAIRAHVLLGNGLKASKMTFRRYVALAVQLPILSHMVSPVCPLPHRFLRLAVRLPGQRGGRRDLELWL